MTKSRSNSSAPAAKGQLVVGTGTDASGILSVSSNGDTLVADSAATTGLRWQGSYEAGKNKIINGDFGIWQRGTSVSIPANNVQTFQADRFWAQHNGTTNGTITYASQAFTAGQTDVPNNPIYFARITNTTLGTSQTQTEFGQSIEDVNTFAGQTATFSFYVKSSGTFTLTGFAWQNFGSGGSDGVFTTLTLSTSTTTTSWQRITATVSVPSVSGKTIGAGNYIAFYIRQGTPTAGSTIDFANWQVEAGSVATAFQTATGTLQGELAACQRYYYRVTFDEAAARLGMGYATSTTVANVTVPFPTTMRTKPTALEQSGTAGDYSIARLTTTTVCSVVPAFTFGHINQGVVTLTVASGLTAGQGIALRNVNTDAFLGWSAEL